MGMPPSQASRLCTCWGFAHATYRKNTNHLRPFASQLAAETGAVVARFVAATCAGSRIGHTRCAGLQQACGYCQPQSNQPRARGYSALFIARTLDFFSTDEEAAQGLASNAAERFACACAGGRLNKSCTGTCSRRHSVARKLPRGATDLFACLLVSAITKRSATQLVQLASAMRVRSCPQPGSSIARDVGCAVRPCALRTIVTMSMEGCCGETADQGCSLSRTQPQQRRRQLAVNKIETSKSETASQVVET